jgi:hypothetical protein
MKVMLIIMIVLASVGACISYRLKMSIDLSTTTVVNEIDIKIDQK